VNDATCKIEGCEKKARGRGWCQTHYSRWRISGDPGSSELLIARRETPLTDRLARIGWDEVLRVPELGPCHEWRGSRNRQGYGQMKINGRGVGAHRAALEARIGPIPDGLLALHRCDNPPCMNGEHLYAGTHSENTIDFYARSGIQRPRGAEHPKAKLTFAQAEEIRARYKAGGVLIKDIAADMNMAAVTISKILHHITYTQ